MIIMKFKLYINLINKPTMVSNKSTIILLGILLSISSAQKTICEQIILEPVKDIMKLNFSSLPLPSIMYSGITNNNPGQMMECQDKNYSYFLVYYNNATTLLDTYTGLCLPP